MITTRPSIRVRQDPVLMLHSLVRLYLRPKFLITFAFASYILGVIALDILPEKDVTRDTIVGSACVYMLMGSVFADIYMLFQIIAPLDSPA